MSDETRTMQLVTEVDATRAKAGFDEVKQGAQSMAQAVAKSGQEASKGVEGIAAATEKLTTQQGRFLESVKKQSVIATEGKAAFLEQKAAMLGVSDAAAGYVAKLRTAEQGQTQLGMSAKATAASLRGVPAQFTDIVVSLQGGQKPITVLLQQGGQLKDMFGGIGPAARALGGYIAGLVNPVTLAAGAVSVLALALHQGAVEQKEFQNAATISGSALGASLSNYAALRDSIAGIAGTRGKAAEVLTEIAGNGQLAGSAVKGIAEAAVLMEKATGQAIGKTVTQFVKLAEAPAAASLELNKTYNYLTAAVYAQIKALEEQGKTFQAAELAEKSFADALQSRATTVIQNVGLLEKAWRGLAGGAKSAWDAMLNVGREDTLTDKLAKAQENVARTQAQLAGVGTFASTGGGAALGGASAARKASLENDAVAAKLQEASASEAVRLEKRVSDSKSEAERVRQRSVNATVAFLKLQEESLTKQQKLEKEIAQARRDGVDAGRSQAEIDRVTAGIRERYKESGSAGTGQSEVAAIRAKVIEQQSYLERLRAQASDVSTIRDPVKLSDGEQQVIKIQQELRTSITGVARAQKEKALAEAQSLANIDKLVIAQERQNKGLKESVDSYDKLIEGTGKAADSILQQALGQEAANAMFGKGKTAIEELTLAQLKNSLAEAEASDRFAPAYVAALAAKTLAQERYVKALQQTEFKQADLKLTEAGRIAGEETQTLQLELSLVGQTQRVREAMVGQRKSELKLAKELLDIDKLNLGTGADADLKRQQLRDQARANSQVETANATAKAVADEWQRTADSINNSITDALLRGFESGKGFAENLRDTIVNMFKTMVLRPIVSAVVNTGTQAVGGALGLSNQGGSSVLSPGNLLSTGNSLFNGGGINGLVSSYAGSGSALGYGLGLSSIAPSAVAGANAIGAIAGGDAIGALAASQGWIAAGEGAALAAGSGAAAAGAGAAGAGALTAGLAAIPVWGWAALGAAVLLGMGGGGKSSSNTGSTSSSFDSAGNQTEYISYGGSSSFADAQVKNLQASYTSTAKALGIGTVGTNFLYGSNNGRNGEINNFSLGATTAGSNFYQAETKLDDASLQLAASRAVFSALKASNLPTYLAGVFDGVDAGAASQDQLNVVLATAQAFKGLHDQLQLLPFDNLKNLTYAAASSLVAFSGGMEKFTSNLSSYFDNFYSAQERSAQITKNIFTTLGAAGVDTSSLYTPSIDSFRALVEAQDVTTASGREAYAALLSVSGAFASLVKDTSAVSVATDKLKAALVSSISNASDLSKAVKAAMGSDVSTVSRADAQAQIAAALAIAKASGTLPSAESLAPALKALTAPSQDLFKTFIDYQRDQARTGGDLAALAGLADAQVTAQQAQLNALGEVNDSVLSVADAVYGLAQALSISRAQAEAAAAVGAENRRIAGFANGGDHFGGLRIVGERGPELEATGPARIINTQNLLAAMGRPQGNNAELVAEIRALREQVARLEGPANVTASATSASERLQRSLTSDGVSLNTTVIA